MKPFAQYEHRMIERLRGTTLPPSVPRPQDWQMNRALADIERAAREFLRRCGLAGTKSETPLLYWEAGPELLTVEGMPFDGKPWTHWAVTGPNGRAADPYQRLLLLEFQSLLMTVYQSLDARANALADLKLPGIADRAFSRLFMALSSESLWTDDRFWDSYRALAISFHQDLLSEMLRFLVRTYEGRHATVGITIVDQRLARSFRWSPIGVDQLPALASEKQPRRLSDGENTTFVFSGHGECFGLFDTALLAKRLEKESRRPVHWRITNPSCLQGYIGITCDRLILEYFEGTWRYVDLSVTRALAQDAEASLGSVNQKLWDVALALSERREGCLILVAKDPKSLVDAAVVDPAQLNTEETGRIGTLTSELSQSIGVPIDLDAPLWSGDHSFSTVDFVLEQYRLDRVDAIPTSILMRMASVDGALIVSTHGRLLGFGVVLRGDSRSTGAQLEGARTTAAKLASKHGAVIKVSSDGPISIYINGDRLG
jgi:hypothetical protein